MECEALNHDSFGAVLSDSKRPNISQQISYLFIVNLWIKEVMWKANLNNIRTDLGKKVIENAGLYRKDHDW